MGKPVCTIGKIYLIAILSFSVVHCSTRLPVAGIKAFHRCDYDQAISIFEKRAKKGGKDYVFYNLALLSAAIQAGDDQKAERAALNAQRVMWSGAGQGRGVASLASAEAIKIFKGEPFEKAMAAIYSGIIYFNREEYDNARAAFTKATLAIKQKQEGHREDFALAYYLQAKTFLKLGQKDNARIALNRARKRFPRNPEFDLSKLKKSNTIFLFELGRAPQKVRKGPGASLADWQRKKYLERNAVLFINGKKLGRTFLSGDLTYQAKTKGRTGKDTIQATKGVTRDVAIATTVIAADRAAKGNKTAGWVALGSGLFAIANQSQADIRQWELLPDRFLVLSAHVPPGTHEFRAKFFDSRKLPLSNLDKVWYYNFPAKDGDRIFLIRSQGCVTARNVTPGSQGKKVEDSL